MNRIRTTNAVCKMIYMSDKICPVFQSGAILRLLFGQEVDEKIAMNNTSS